VRAANNADRHDRSEEGEETLTPSERIAEKLGYAHEDELIHRDNMVLMV